MVFDVDVDRLKGKGAAQIRLDDGAKLLRSWPL